MTNQLDLTPISERTAVTTPTIDARQRAATLLTGNPAQVDRAALVTLLDEADTAYYDADAPLFDDATYDRLTELFRARTGQPWQRLGNVSSELTSVPHVLPTLSLTKVYNLAELREFKTRTARALASEALSPDTAADTLAVTVEPKIDGLTLVLEYRHGRLTRALTRGNGRVGEDVTHNVRGLSGIPTSIPWHLSVSLFIRGEAYLPLSRFAALRAAGEDVATPRNTAAGDIRRKTEPGSSAARRAQQHGVTFLAYSLDLDPQATPADLDGITLPATQPDVYDTLNTWGFTAPTYHVAVEGPYANEDLAQPASETARSIVSLLEETQGADFASDGLVLKVVDRSAQTRLGATDRAVRWAVAFKQLGAEYETTVRVVHWQAGRVGQITPVLECDPVDMDGAQISRYTAHHAAFFRELGATVGSRVIVTRAGDVIPQVLRLADGQEPANPIDLAVPEVCPACATPLAWRNGVALICPNPTTCPPKLLGAIDHFAARDNMDISGLGSELIAALIKSQLVRSPLDLYRLDEATLASLPLANGQLYGERRAQTLCASIAASRTTPYPRLLHALGVPGLGQPECRTIAQHFGLDDLLARAQAGTLVDDVTALHGVGPATAGTLATYLVTHSGWLSQATELGLQTQRVAPATAVDGPLSGKTFVVTGTLNLGSREQVEAFIAARGGRAVGSVGASTSYLVTGDKPGKSKLDAARKHSVPILDEPALLALLEEGPVSDE